jgi:hypothetical protein
MGSFQKTTCNFGAAPRRAAERENFAELDATDLKRAFGSGKPWESKVITVRLSKNHCSPYNFLKIRPAKKWTIWGILGLNFRGFFSSLLPSERSRRPNRRPNRAAVTPIGQQNPPGPLKLLGLRKKTGKNTDFDFAQIHVTL